MDTVEFDARNLGVELRARFSVHCKLPFPEPTDLISFYILANFQWQARPVGADDETRVHPQTRGGIRERE
jgi:hypothetical protein